MMDKALVGIYILEILEKYASETKSMTQEKLISWLNSECEIVITRKTLSGYLNQLRSCGYIVGKRGVYKVNKFNDTELRLLIDSVFFTKNISESKAKILIEKLKSMSNQNFSNRIRHIHYLGEMQHTDNLEIYNNIDIIDNAIERNKKIKLTQSIYGIDGKLYEKGTSIVSPYYIVTSNSRYYLICFKEGNQDLENRRIDRITKVEELSENRTDLRKIRGYENGNFSLPQYMKEHIYMWSGQSAHIRIKIRKNSIGEIIDWYGKDYKIMSEDPENVVIRINANEDAVYFWAMQYGKVVEVMEPDRLRKRIREGLSDMLGRYEMDG